MADLYPTFEVPDMTGETGSIQNIDRYSVFFDFETGDFRQNKKGQMVEASPYDAWVQWCLKTVYTERYQFFAYSSNIGVEMAEAMAEPSRSAQESSIERTITEALLADPYNRTVYVRDFVFEWGVDSLRVTCNVGGIWDVEAEISVDLN